MISLQWAQDGGGQVAYCKEFTLIYSSDIGPINDLCLVNY